MQVTHENTKCTKKSQKQFHVCLGLRHSLEIKILYHRKIALQHTNVKIYQYVLVFYFLSVTHTGCLLQIEGGTGGLGKERLQSWFKVIFIAQDIFFLVSCFLFIYFLVLFSFVFSNYKFKLR